MQLMQIYKFAEQVAIGDQVADLNVGKQLKCLQFLRLCAVDIKRMFFKIKKVLEIAGVIFICFILSDRSLSQKEQEVKLFEIVLREQQNAVAEER